MTWDSKDIGLLLFAPGVPVLMILLWIKIFRRASRLIRRVFISVCISVFSALANGRNDILGRIALALSQATSGPLR